MSSRFLIHPGYPKTGTTSLQERLFAHHGGMRALSGYPHDSAAGPEDNLHWALCVSGDSTLQKQLFESVLTPQIALDQVNVFSSESMLLGRRAPKAVAQDLVRLIPQAKVLIMLRPQIDVLRSWYDMVPYAGQDPEQRWLTFEDWLDGALVPQNPLYDHDFGSSLRYVETIAAWREIYGADNVLVYSMERFFGDADARRVLFDQLDLEDTGVAEALSSGHDNTHSQRRFRRVARRILGPFRASSVLSLNQIRWIGQQMNRFVPDRRTVVSDAQSARVANRFDEQDIAALKAQGWEGLFL